LCKSVVWVPRDALDHPRRLRGDVFLASYSHRLRLAVDHSIRVLLPLDITLAPHDDFLALVPVYRSLKMTEGQVAALRIRLAR